MRRSTPPFVLALSLVASGLAAQEESRYRLFAGVEPGASYSESSGLDFEAAYLLGLDAYFAPRWALEVAAAFQRESFDNGLAAVTVETSNLDAAGRFDMMRKGSLTLYGLSGLRYSETRDSRRLVRSDGSYLRESGTFDRAGLLLGLGAELDVSRRFSLRLAVKHVPWNLTGDSLIFEDTSFSTALAVRF
ncbi:MAG: outer membrane beta-barrel protein [Acidobacteriota bacterium]|nr:outer membrane beta-barrel protein [Acidobacteriota bacterium]